MFFVVHSEITHHDSVKLLLPAVARTLIYGNYLLPVGRKANNWDGLFQVPAWHIGETAGKRVSLRDCLAWVGLWACL